MAFCNSIILNTTLSGNVWNNCFFFPFSGLKSCSCFCIIICPTYVVAHRGPNIVKPPVYFGVYLTVLWFLRKVLNSWHPIAWFIVSYIHRDLMTLLVYSSDYLNEYVFHCSLKAWWSFPSSCADWWLWFSISQLLHGKKVKMLWLDSAI